MPCLRHSYLAPVPGGYNRGAPTGLFFGAHIRGFFGGAPAGLLPWPLRGLYGVVENVAFVVIYFEAGEEFEVFLSKGARLVDSFLVFHVPVDGVEL